MVKIGVISDTHGLLREEVLEILRDCDCIFHGGDINNQGVLDARGKIAPVYVVRGNNDKEWAEQLPHDLTVRMEGRKIFMVHNRKEIDNLPEDADIVIFNPDYRGVVKLADNPNGVDYNIYEGREQIGQVETVLLRGKKVVEHAQFVGEMGQGEFIPSKPYAYCFEGRE